MEPELKKPMLLEPELKKPMLLEPGYSLISDIFSIEAMGDNVRYIVGESKCNQQHKGNESER